MKIEGSVALVTGGGNGIGEAVVKHLARKGCKVVVVDIAQNNIDRVVGELKDMGCSAAGVQGNVTSEADTAKFVQTAIQTFGQLNIVIPCAGIIKDAMLLSLDKTTGKVSRKMPLDRWQAVLDVNLTGTFLTLRDSAEAMVNGGWQGVLIPISSVNKVGQVGQLNYSAVKAAIAIMPKVIVGEFMMRGIKNIRCVAVAPGYTATPMVAGMNQDALNAICADMHLGRLIQPDEIAFTIAHIIENDAIDGATLEVTGGLCYKGNIAK